MICQYKIKKKIIKKPAWAGLLSMFILSGDKKPFVQKGGTCQLLAQTASCHMSAIHRASGSVVTNGFLLFRKESFFQCRNIHFVAHCDMRAVPASS